MDFELLDGNQLVAETRLLTGSQAKTAFALRLNCAYMVEKYGVNRSGFLTLTVGDWICPTHGKQIPTGRRGQCPCCKKKMPFKQVFDMEKASRRLHNLLRRVLPLIFLLGIIVTERCQNGAIHFHILGVLLHDWDIRTGFNFEQVKRRNYTSVCAELRGIWAELRRVLPKYGFGRAELMPIRKTGEAVASYISKYIEKNVMNRPASDKGKKLVRYFGWGKSQLKPNEFEWNSKGGQTWRSKMGQLAKIGGLRVWDNSANDVESRVQAYCDLSAGKIRPKCFNGSMLRETFGPRWAYTGTNILRQVWGDYCDVLTMTPRAVLLAQNLLIEARRKYERELVATFRWLKGLEINAILAESERTGMQLPFPPLAFQDEETATRAWWAIEDEATGFTVPEDYFGAGSAN
jgi:hypothetical protein